MRTRVPLLAALLAALAVIASGCGGAEPIVAKAVFDDVVDLTSGHAVKLADVPIGSVEGIELTEDNQALVTMNIDADIELPSGVSARLRKTNVLGERFVELVVETDSGGTFESGTTITDTTTVPELEEVVGTGTELIMAVAADTLAGAIEAGAEGMDGRGDTLGQVLTDLNTLVGTYDENSEDLVRLVEGFEDFLDDAGPAADVHGRALEEFARFTRTLQEEDERLVDTLTDVRRLANTGTDIITTHRGRFDAFFTRFDRLTGEVVARDDDLDELFRNVYLHNHNTIRGVNAELAQVFFDFIVCGVNDEPGDPVRACDDPPQGKPAPQPRPPQDYR